MTPERLEEIREMYQLHPEVMEVITAYKATMEGMAAQLQTFCPPEEAATLRAEAASAREVVEAARECHCKWQVKEAIERYDEEKL